MFNLLGQHGQHGQRGGLPPGGARGAGATDVLTNFMERMIGSSGSSSNPPLVSGASNGAPTSAKRLKRPGGTRSLADNQLHIACGSDDMETVLRMLESGADPNVRDSSDCTPLKFAASRGLVGISRLLMRYGAKLGDGDEVRLLLSILAHAANHCRNIGQRVNTVL